MLSVQQIHPLNMPVTIPVEFHAGEDAAVGDARLQAVVAQWGQCGYHPPIPTGGWVIPYTTHNLFDWRLIGAVLTHVEGREAVRCAGHYWFRRDLAPNANRNIQAAIKYSRGAKSADPEHVREGTAEGGQYVPLVAFRGAGDFKQYHRR